jgi:hypothetical protein
MRQRAERPLELGVARRRGRMDASTLSESGGRRSPVRATTPLQRSRRGGQYGRRRQAPRGPGCALLRVDAGSQASIGSSVIRVVFWVHHPEAPSARCPSLTSRPARPAAAKSRSDASSAWPAGNSRTELLPRARRSTVTGCGGRGATGWWLRGNRRLIACEAGGSPQRQVRKYLQIAANGRGHQCPGMGLIRPNTAGFGPTNGPTASSITTARGDALRR